MYTNITINHDRIKNGNAMNLLKKYSDQPDKLIELVNEIGFSFVIEGVRPYFEGDKEPRLTLRVSMERNGKKISFSYGTSLYDTAYYRALLNNAKSDLIKNLSFVQIKQKWLEFQESLIYSVLCNVKIDFYIEPIFEDFCEEMGYSTDSIKAFKLWQECLKQSQKVRKIFKESEIDCLPS